ncbi:MAG: BolA family transcriptional regulator [Alphaproteobacteria bacterium]|nr:MAG: BolA family transcriptional regulator [Alphaproteobacteria bacterium]
MSVASDIEQKLRDALSPTALEVTDDSHQHAGHSGASPGGETHFSVKITAQAFEGLNRVAQQRLVYKILAEEMAGPVHALAIEAKAG